MEYDPVRSRSSRRRSSPPVQVRPSAHQPFVAAAPVYPQPALKLGPRGQLQPSPPCYFIQQIKEPHSLSAHPIPSPQTLPQPSSSFQPHLANTLQQTTHPPTTKPTPPSTPPSPRKAAPGTRSAIPALAKFKAGRGSRARYGYRLRRCRNRTRKMGPGGLDRWEDAYWEWDAGSIGG